MLLLGVVQLVQNEPPFLVEEALPPRRQVRDHLLRDLSDDLLDERVVQEVVVLPVTSLRHSHCLEEQVAGEELHGDAGDAPDVRLLVPLHVHQHFWRAVLARVDDALASVGGVGRAAVVDHCIAEMNGTYPSRRWCRVARASACGRWSLLRVSERGNTH